MIRPLKLSFVVVVGIFVLPTVKHNKQRPYIVLLYGIHPGGGPYMAGGRLSFFIIIHDGGQLYIVLTSSWLKLLIN